MATTTLRPIDQLTSDWEALRRSAPSRAALRALEEAEPAVADLGAADLGELVSTLRAAGGRQERDAAAGVLRAMLRSQSVHPMVPRAILQALLPGLVSVARRLSWGSGGEWSDGGTFFVDVLTTAWEVIVEWSGDDRDYAVLDLLSAVRCRLRRQLLRYRASLAPALPAELADAPGGPSTTALDELARALDEVTAQDVDASDAAVLYAHRVLGYSMTEIAVMTGRSRRHLGARRDRAVRALIA